MIAFNNLWETMKKQGVSTYLLRVPRYCEIYKRLKFKRRLLSNDSNRLVLLFLFYNVDSVENGDNTEIQRYKEICGFVYRFGV